MYSRILFITSEFGGIPEGMTNTLKKMQVNFKDAHIWQMEEATEIFKPEVTIFFHHFLKNFDTYIERVSKMGGHKILWSWEEPWEIDYLIKYAHNFTFVFTQDKNSANAINQIMKDKAVHVPHAADPITCRPMNVPFEYRSDLCFIGANYPSRAKFFRAVLPKLRDYKVIIGGTGWEFLPDVEGQKILNNGVTPNDYIKYINGAKVNVNLHRLSEEMTISNGEHVKASSPNNRFFETYMCNAFQLTDEERYPELKEYFPNAVVFNNPDNFVEAFKGYIADEEARKNNARINYEHALQFHTYEKRFTDIIAPLI